MRKFVLCLLLMLSLLLVSGCKLEAEQKHHEIELEERKDTYEHLDMLTLYYPDGTKENHEVYYDNKSVQSYKSGIYCYYYINDERDSICKIEDGTVFFKELEDYYEDVDNYSYYENDNIDYNVFTGTFKIENVR